MSSLTKTLNLGRVIGTLCNRFSLINIQVPQPQLHKSLRLLPTSNSFHTSPPKQDLMEFFDNKDNWGENQVKCGRAWNKDELRIKSNTELHQLWYILLKEKNMLLTMEHECNDQMKLFPSPERLDKVDISMTNLEAVVRERNKAYHLLETGETGERPGRLVANPLGIKYYYKAKEHALPPHMNLKWIKKQPIGFTGRAVRKFLLLYREKLYNEKRKGKNRSRNHVMMLMRRNPNLSIELLQKKYPDVDVDKLLKSDKIRGHYAPKVGA
ncbi:39S ribosomal protein L47, mitochondrial [Episyrphus balteatus]|uniref:39S ribosomal protein L47, mitochondrial n=1 Tax=Episyrphus balteatus TaxID=286459 RepID=UPI002485100B|nr:39S ribosomal protein L47, mitochondrial [Episyrphus balteatus]